MKELHPSEFVDAHLNGDMHALRKDQEVKQIKAVMSGAIAPAKKINPLVVLSIVIGSWLVLISLGLTHYKLQPKPFCQQSPELSRSC